MSRRLLYWTVQTLGWGAVGAGFVGLVLATGNNGKGISPRDAAEAAMALWVTLLASSHALRMLIRRGRWLELGAAALGTRLVAGALVVALGAQGLMTVVGAGLAAARGEPVALDASTLSGAAGSVAILATFLVAWGLAYVFARTAGRLRASELEALALRAALAEAELATLRAQVNPHFLFNALNTVRALVTEDPEAARLAVTRLSTLLRATLAAGPGEHPLAAELDLACAYLDLERLRFEERLTVEIDVPDAALGVPVPTLLLLTLVENAAKHGIADRPEGGTVRVGVRLDGGALVLRVENPPAPAGAAPDGTRTGLRTVRERLALHYGAAGRLDADFGDAASARPAVVTVTLPSRPAPGSAADRTARLEGPSLGAPVSRLGTAARAEADPRGAMPLVR